MSSRSRLGGGESGEHGGQHGEPRKLRNEHGKRVDNEAKSVDGLRDFADRLLAVDDQRRDNQNRHNDDQIVEGIGEQAQFIW